MLFDTDVLVWLTRGHPGAGARVERESSRNVSIMSVMELLEGSRDRRDTVSIQKSLAAAGMMILPLNEAVGYRAAEFMEEYVLSIGLDTVDAIIAATAVEHGLPLCTANHKHFKSIEGLQVSVFRP